MNTESKWLAFASAPDTWVRVTVVLVLLVSMVGDVNARSSRDRILGGAGSQSRSVIKVHDFDVERVSPAPTEVSDEEEFVEEEAVEVEKPEVQEEVFIKRTVVPIVKPEVIEPKIVVQADSPSEGESPMAPFIAMNPKGYLSDKGPSKLKVEVAENSILQPLDSVIWDLILGNSSYYTKSTPVSQNGEEPQSSTNNSIIPGQTNTANELRMNYQNNSTPNIPANQAEEANTQGSDSVALQDQAESHRQLLDFFSNQVNPFGMTPGVNAPFMGYQPSMVGQQPTVRQGSRARFEIRRN